MVYVCVSVCVWVCVCVCVSVCVCVCVWNEGQEQIKEYLKEIEVA